MPFTFGEPMFEVIARCRICGNPNLVPILNLGEQFLTGIFPKNREQKLTSGPLELIRCRAFDSQTCGLVQLRQSYSLDEMYGENYGYRSSLNKTMVRHLQQKVENLLRNFPLKSGDLMLDIGSNDGTLLSFYPSKNVSLVGMDPTSGKFEKFYRADIHRIADFFSAQNFRAHFKNRQAKIVTSIAMFYDLESPLSFMRDVREILAPDGVWHFEQSYLPLMLQQNAYDTICHEHREYYALKQIKWMTDRAGLKILEVETNDVNGGSFAVTVARDDSSFSENSAAVESFLQAEENAGLNENAGYDRFVENVFCHKQKLIALLNKLKNENAKVLGYGASTKGNVILQFCGITPELLPAIAEVNEDKFGAFTPGTLIPIISEVEAHARQPDYLVVFPWHFRENLLAREAAFLQRGGKMIFPLPQLESVGAGEK